MYAHIGFSPIKNVDINVTRICVIAHVLTEMSN